MSNNKKQSLYTDTDPLFDILGESSGQSILADYIRQLEEKRSLYDNVRIKKKVQEMLRENKYLSIALNAKNESGEYMSVDKLEGKYILPLYLLVPTQTSTDNYICYETSFTEMPRYNDILKYQQITFNILCKCTSTEGETYDGNIIDSETGFARHDLIAILLTEQFNWSDELGFQIHLVSDQSRPVDNGYCARTLVFEQTTPNSIVKNGKVYNNAK